jgi:ubiquinone/menaquinone biosynthesis C-methylase UbiE
MRDQFKKTVVDPRVSCEEGTFDAIPVADSSADALIVAQAFHWCPDYNAASAEFARVLKPGGAVFLVWNLEDREKARWVAQLRDAYEQHENGTPQFRLGLWRATFDTPNYMQFFEKPIEEAWCVFHSSRMNTHRYDAETKSCLGRILYQALKMGLLTAYVRSRT